MLSLTVDIENAAPVLSAIAGLSSQLPYITSRAINATVNDVQTAIKASLHDDFHLRHAVYVENTVYRQPGQDFATKTKLEGAVRINPARDILAKFELDTEKTSISGHALAIPVQRQQHPDLIIGRGDPRNIKHVMALIESQGGKAVGPFKKRGAKRAQQQSFFLIHTKAGQTLVMQYDAGTKRVLYVFKPDVPITSHRLHFDDIAMPTALAAWDKNFDEAISVAMATAR